MKYRDFLIQINSDGGGFTACLLGSPAGDGIEESFEPPFDRDELPIFLHRLNTRIRGVRHTMSATETMASPENPRKIGEALFQALFTGRIRDAHQRSLGGVGGLRIKLKLNPRVSELAQIQNLPWELLAYPGDVGFLSLSPAHPIVRYLDAPIPIRSPPLPLKLRVLLAASQPPDLSALDLEGELRRLLSSQSIWTGGARLEFTHPRGGCHAAGDHRRRSARFQRSVLPTNRSRRSGRRGGHRGATGNP